MKTLITTLNSKFIHTSLSLRLLYVASYHEHDVDFKEYTIKDSLEHIVEDILRMQCQIVAFSSRIYSKNMCYAKEKATKYHYYFRWSRSDI